MTLSPVISSSELDELSLLHDKEPDQVAEALCQVASVSLADHIRFAWLVNHVVGEKKGLWGRASVLLEKTVASSAEPAVLRHRAIAALFAGDALNGLALLTQFADAAGVSLPLALAAVRLGVLQFSREDLPAIHLAGPFLAVVEQIQTEFSPPCQIAAILAAGLNNVTSRLMDERPGDDPLYRQALTQGAAVCKAIWTVAGTWINQERADYLIALSANRIDDFKLAKQAAEAGLNTIDRFGQEDVDRAFLLLELSRALHGLGETAQGIQARADAEQLAQDFDPSLREWFDFRAQG
jgi:hypothetical protein